MKKNKSIKYVISIILCLIPLAFGIAVYDKLPENVAIHFTINDTPDNYASKKIAVIAFPIIMAIVQFLCITVMYKYYKNKENAQEPKMMKIFVWYVPILTISIYTLMILHALNYNIPIGKCVCFLIGIIFIVIGNYMPKMDYETGSMMIHPKPKDEKAFRKMTRIMGYSFVIGGVAFLIIMFFV